MENKEGKNVQFQVDEDELAEHERLFYDINLLYRGRFYKRFNIEIKEFEIGHTNQKGESILHLFTKEGKYKLIQQLIDRYPDLDVNLRCKNENTPFMLAVRSGSVETMELLKNHGANMRERNAKGQNALHFAGLGGNAECVKKILEWDGDFLLNRSDDKYMTPLMTAAASGNHEVVLALLNANAPKINDWNIQPWKNRGCIHFSALNNHTNCIRHFITDINLPDGDGATPLIMAARKGHLESVEFLLNIDKTDVNLQNKKGWAAIHYAALSGNVWICEKLIEAKAYLNLKNHEGETPLILASREGREKIVDVILKCPGFNKQSVNQTDINGRSALHWAAVKGRRGLVNQLVKADADIDLGDRGDETALMLATQEGHLEIVLDLIQLGADTNACNPDGKTPLMFAASQGYVNVVETLLKYRKTLVNQKDYKWPGTPYFKEWTAAHYASHHGHAQCLKKLIEANADLRLKSGENVEETCLILAVKEGHEECVDVILNSPGFLEIINLKDYRGRNALHWAAKLGHLGCVKRLVAAGIELNEKDTWDHECDDKVAPNQTALILAAEGGHADVVLYLLEAGGDPLISGYNGTALQYACLKNSKGQFDVIKLLLDNTDLDVNAVDHMGCTPLICCINSMYEDNCSTEAVEYLIEHGADVHHKSDYGDDSLHIASMMNNVRLVKVLLNAQADVNSTNNNWSKLTPLLYAACCGQASNLSTLIEYGAKIDQVDSDGNTALHLAAMGKNLKCVKLLLDAKANLNVKNNLGKTPLMNAVSDEEKYTAEDLVQVVLALLEAGADPNLKDNDDQTALNLCKSQVVKDLLVTGIDSLSPVS